MERDKKNKLENAEYPSLNEGQTADVASVSVSLVKMPPEINGPKGPEPTRYNDWEQKGRCTDF